MPATEPADSTGSSVSPCSPNVGVHGSRREVEVAAQRVAEARGIQDRAGADHAAGVHAGELPRRVAQDVHRVAGNQEDAVEAVFHHVADDRLEDCGVLGNEVQSSLPRLLRRARADADHRGIAAVLVGANRHAGVVVRPRHCVVEVLYVPPGLALVQVDDSQVVGQTLVDQGVCVGDADVARADENDLGAGGRWCGGGVIVRLWSSHCGLLPSGCPVGAFVLY